MKAAPAVALVLALWALPAFADYYVAGEMTGEQCTSYVLFDFCNFVRIDAVKGSDGQLWTIADRFSRVDEHHDGRCWISIKSRGAGLIPWGVNALVAPEFFTKTSARTYELVDVEYITFPCEQR